MKKVLRRKEGRKGKKGRRECRKKEESRKRAGDAEREKLFDIYLEVESSFLLGGRILACNRPQHTPHRVFHIDLCSEKFILWSQFQRL